MRGAAGFSGTKDLMFHHRTQRGKLSHGSVTLNKKKDKYDDAANAERVRRHAFLSTVVSVSIYIPDGNCAPFPHLSEFLEC